MTVKNGERYLKQCLDSVFNQTYPIEQVIVVDDGSTDGTLSVLEDYRSIRPILKVMPTAGIGRSKALNLAWREANAHWIANIDADDLWMPEKLEAQIRVANTDETIAAVCTAAKVVNLGDPVQYGTEQSRLDSKKIPKACLFSRNPVNHSSVIIKKSLLEAVGGYDNSRLRLVDHDLWVRIYQSGQHFVTLEGQFTIKRIHPDQSFEQTNRLGYLVDAIRLDYSALNKLDAPFYFYLMPLIKFTYGLLPARVRLLLRNLKSWLMANARPHFLRF
jgi:glycosyltransferase involved in cell wall biosynthesis